MQGLHNESRQIVEEAAHGSSLEGNVHDAGSQIRLLNEELTFNHGIEASLKRLQAIRQDLDNIQQAILEDHLPEATHQIRDVEAQGLLQGSPLPLESRPSFLQDAPSYEMILLPG